jgi:hypothetical protein
VIYSRSHLYSDILVHEVQSLHWILLETNSTDSAKKCTTAFTRTLIRNYGQVRADVPSPQFRRYALLSYGYLTISLLHWAPEFQEDHAMKKRALDSGLRYLRAAGDSVETMDMSIFDLEAEAPYEDLFEEARAIITVR